MTSEPTMTSDVAQEKIQITSVQITWHSVDMRDGCPCVSPTTTVTSLTTLDNDAVGRTSGLHSRQNILQHIRY